MIDHRNDFGIAPTAAHAAEDLRDEYVMRRYERAMSTVLTSTERLTSCEGKKAVGLTPRP